MATKPVALRVSADERRRLTTSKPLSDLRYHYRIGAGALALETAQLLPNDSEELADIINRAGFWIKEEDEKLGNRYYQILERRAPQTAIGRAAIARHWFVDQAGPWSEEAGKPRPRCARSYTSRHILNCASLTNQSSCRPSSSGSLGKVSAPFSVQTAKCASGYIETPANSPRALRA